LAQCSPRLHANIPILEHVKQLRNVDEAALVSPIGFGAMRVAYCALRDAGEYIQTGSLRQCPKAFLAS
jgi:hypothetical protein